MQNNYYLNTAPHDSPFVGSGIIRAGTMLTPEQMSDSESFAGTITSSSGDAGGIVGTMWSSS